MATGSINIPARKDDLKGNCDGKCSLSFKYQASACTVTNKGNYLSFGYENNDSQIVFNSSNYKVEDIRLYRPSINTFNSDRLDAELVVLHKNNLNENLAICVPVKKSNSSTPASSLFNQILSAAPVSNDERATVSVTDYSLNHFIPKASFYSYTGNLPWDRNIKNVNFVVFDKNQSNANIDDNTFELLKRLIEEKTFSVSEDADVFYNKKGSTNIGGKQDTDIYIDCQPTGVDSLKNKSISFKVPTNSSTNSFTALFKTKWMKVIFQVVLVLLAFSGVIFVLTALRRLWRRFMARRRVIRQARRKVSLSSPKSPKQGNRRRFGFRRSSPKPSPQVKENPEKSPARSTRRRFRVRRRPPVSPESEE